MKSIVIYYGNQKSESYNLEQFQKEVVSFGRQPDNDIVLDLEFVSRIHGVFYMEEGICAGSEQYEWDTGEWKPSRAICD